MRHPILSTRQAVLGLAIVLAVGSVGHAQLSWMDIAHPDDSHAMSYDARISIPPLLSDPNEVIILPVLVILIEFPDAIHQSFHPSYFYEDFTFGDGTGPFSINHPSLRQIIWEITNGRVWLVPAEENYDLLNDGIVGWMTAKCNPTMYTGGYCIGGPEDGEECDLAVPGACEAGGGHCEPCDSWEYYRWKDLKKRAEAIRLADPYINFSSYDTMDGTWGDGADNQITYNEIAVVVIHARPACTDEHGHGNWGGGGDCNVGAVRPTDPSPIPADGIALLQHPTAIPEGASSQVFAHEFCHQVFGLGDLYNISWGHCNPEVHSTDGTICYPWNPTANPPAPPCNDDCADAVCLDDATLWGGSYVAKGSTAGATGVDYTPPCGTNDTADVWFTYTPSESGNAIFSVTGTGMDATIAVYESCTGIGFGCDASPPTSSVTIPVTAGVTYWVRVAGENNGTGSYTLNIENGLGRCTNPYDSKWFPEGPVQMSIMDSYARPVIPHMSPWANIHLGFTKPVVAADDGTYTLYQAETIRSITQQTTEPEALVVHDLLDPDAHKKYFILENRATESRTAPGTTIDEGLAIWRIHEFPLPGESELAPKRVIQLVRPKFWSNLSELLWDGSDPGYYDLTPGSWPRNTEWTGREPSYIEFTNISVAGPVMTVDVRLPGVFVDVNNAGAEAGTPAHPYDTVTEAVDTLRAAGRDLTIRTKPGTYTENGLVIDTPCTIKPWGSGTVYIGQ